MTSEQKTESPGVLPRMGRFLHKPWREKIASIRNRWHSAAASIPVPLRLPFGAWWLLRNDNLGQPLRAGEFETAELAFADRFLRPGMTVLDIGAHHGLHTLLASRRVGALGRVFSFEPSPRERRALRLHLALNFRANVTVLPMAVGSEETEANLFVVQGYQTGCNSLRPPIVLSETKPVRVEVVRLDDWLEAHKIDQVDFIKLDVEGGELEALKGAEKLLERRPRPVILAEVQDIRTEPWGYKAKEIVDGLIRRGYKWFSIAVDGSLEELDVSSAGFDGNFVAAPLEREGELRTGDATIRGASEGHEPGATRGRIRANLYDLGPGMPEAPETRKMICPSCQGTAVRRSQRQGVREALLHWLLFISPYRCQDCDQRFFGKRLVMAKKHRNGHAV